MGNPIKSFIENGTDDSRREFLKQSAFVTASIITGVGLGYGIKEGPKLREEFKSVLYYPKSIQNWTKEQYNNYIETAFKAFIVAGQEGVTRLRDFVDFRETQKIEVQKHNLSCEFATVSALLLWNGVRVTKHGEQINEETLISHTRKAIFNNPTTGKPDNLDGEPYLLPPLNSYGIYPHALARDINPLIGDTNKLLLPYDFKDLPDQYVGKSYLEQLATFSPCAIWFQQFPELGKPQLIKDEFTPRPSKEERHLVAPSEHCALALSIGKDYTMYADPINWEVLFMENYGNEGLLKKASNVGMGFMAVDKEPNVLQEVLTYGK